MLTITLCAEVDGKAHALVLQSRLKRLRLNGWRMILNPLKILSRAKARHSVQ